MYIRASIQANAWCSDGSRTGSCAPLATLCLCEVRHTDQYLHWLDADEQQVTYDAAFRSGYERSPPARADGVAARSPAVRVVYKARGQGRSFPASYQQAGTIRPSTRVSRTRPLEHSPYRHVILRRRDCCRPALAHEAQVLVDLHVQLGERLQTHARRHGLFA